MISSLCECQPFDLKGGKGDDVVGRSSEDIPNPVSYTGDVGLI